MRRILPSRHDAAVVGVWLALAAGIAILGIALRFYHLNWKVYSYDETVTSIRASGHLIGDFVAFVDDGKIHALTDLRKFQTSDPELSYASTVASLAREDPQHPPAYFLIARGVSALGHASVAVWRLPAAIFAVLLLPAFWCLSFELFGSCAVAWTALALIAVSPFHLAYAQQNREYSLWALAVVLSSTFLLRALRRPVAFGAWLLYGIATAASLWIYTLSLCVLLAHALFVMFAGDRAPSARRNFLLTSASALASFVPWIVMIARNTARVNATTEWDNAALPLKLMAEKWLFNGVCVFFDLDYVSLWFVPVAAVVAVFVFVVGYMLTRAALRTRSQPHAFVLILGSVSGLSLVVPDIIRHQSHSTQARYLTPLWLGIELAAAYAIGSGGWSGNGHGPKELAWRTAGLLIVCLGAASCLVSSQARYWWLASDAKAIPAIAQVLDASRPAGLIAYSADDFSLLELADVVRAPLHFSQREPTANQPDAPRGGSIFVIGRAAQLGHVRASIRPASLYRIVLPVVFPRPDDSLSALRAENARARFRIAAKVDNVALWTIPSLRSRSR